LSLTHLTTCAALDDYLDQRWLPPADAHKATQDLMARLRQASLGMQEVEGLLRAPRAKYPAPPKVGEALLIKGLVCEHVDYTTSFVLFVPKSYDAARQAPLLLIGHGGNSAMNAAYATQATLAGLTPWLPVAEKEGIVLAGPLSERGWGPIGNSILFSLISRLQRSLNLHPDRIYITGHSMGGHLSWRSGIYLGDRWGAVAPMSGGYDYVTNKEVYALVNVPGYSTFGKVEPYNINLFNRKIKAWMTAHDYDWQFVEKSGGHEIYRDELPKVAKFLFDHPRNLYRPAVYATTGKSVVFNAPGENDKWPKPHTWNPQRPIPYGSAHWVRLFALPDATPKDKSRQMVWAENLGQNVIRLTAQNTPRVRLYLHPRMVDFAKPVEVIVNGKTAFKNKVAPSLETMLELVREYDDRGRIFHAAIEVEIKNDAVEMPEPRGWSK
jgi:pimeloyl-ACP methyl ester carboxylesterase